MRHSFPTHQLHHHSESSPNALKPSEGFPKQLDIAEVAIYGLSLLTAGVLLFLPFLNLLHPSPWQRWMGTLHGCASLFALITLAYGGHLAFPLMRGSANILPKMRILSLWSSILSFLAIATGNLAYMRYRAGSDFGGARAWLTENTPLVHYILMEYHQFSVLFTLPLAVSSAWVLWRYGDSILEKHNRPILTATCLTLMAMMFFALGGVVSGLGIAKVHAL